MEYGVHRGVVVTLAIAQLQFGGDLRSAIGLLEGSTVENLESLIDDFDDDTNTLLGEVSVNEIIHNLGYHAPLDC